MTTALLLTVGMAETHAQDATSEHVGAPFSSDSEPLALVDAISACADSGSVCKVEGTVDRVCQARGCWFTLSDPAVDLVVRIRMQDYGFFVPRDAMGAHVVFEGLLTQETIAQEQAQHYADDEAAGSATPARVVEGPEDIYQFMITGAEISR